MQEISSKKHWQEYWNTKDHQPLVTHKELLENLQDTTNIVGKKILEIGAGMGGDSIFLAKHGAIVTALDFTNEAIDAIKKNAQREKVTVETIRADARKIPFPQETFDVIFHQGFLEHFPEPSKIMDEQVRVLKKGGFVVIDVPQTFTTYTIKKHVLMWQGKWFAGWEREFTAGQLIHIVQQAKLKPVKLYGWGYYGKLYSMRHLHLGSGYEKLWSWLESSKLKLYLSWCIGIIAQKI